MPRCSGSGDVYLKVNVVTSVVGHAAVALLDAAGAYVPGFEPHAADAILGNFIARTVTWDNGQRISLRAVAGQRVAVQVELPDAQLFSVAFECG